MSKEENTPKELTASEFLEYYSIDDKDVFGRHDEYYRLDHLMEEFVKLKLQQANKREILGDRRIVVLEHDKMVLKSQIKEKDAMLEEMKDALLLLRNEYSENGSFTGRLYEIANKPLIKYENSK